jgi:hypothetical protein
VEGEDRYGVVLSVEPDGDVVAGFGIDFGDTTMNTKRDLHGSPGFGGLSDEPPRPRNGYAARIAVFGAVAFLPLFLFVAGCSGDSTTTPPEPEGRAEIVTVAATWTDCLSTIGCRFEGEARNDGNADAVSPRGWVRFYRVDNSQIGTAFAWERVAGGGAHVVRPGQTFIYRTRDRVPNAVMESASTYSIEVECNSGC